MKKILLLAFFISMIINIHLHAIDVQSLFNLSSNGDIVYYNSYEINNDEYAQAEKLKLDLQKQGYNVYSLLKY